MSDPVMLLTSQDPGPVDLVARLRETFEKLEALDPSRVAWKDFDEHTRLLMALEDGLARAERLACAVCLPLEVDRRARLIWKPYRLHVCGKSSDRARADVAD